MDWGKDLDNGIEGIDGFCFSTLALTDRETADGPLRGVAFGTQGRFQPSPLSSILFDLRMTGLYVAAKLKNSSSCAATGAPGGGPGGVVGLAGGIPGGVPGQCCSPPGVVCE